MPKARTSRSSTAGLRTSSIGCQLWQPIWFAGGSRSSLRPAAPLRPSQPRRQPRPFRLCSRSQRTPVRLGLVASLSRPRGNATGINFFSSELVEKRLEVLRELVPNALRVAVLVNPADASNTEATVKGVETVAHAMALQVQFFRASTSGEIQAAFERLAHERPDVLFVGGDPFFLVRRVQLATLAALHRLPASFSNREHVEAGGLMSYGTNINDVFRQAGIYIGRVLKGEKPADLPVMQPTTFELVINLPTVMALGLTVPDSLLARADEVIE